MSNKNNITSVRRPYTRTVWRGVALICLLVGAITENSRAQCDNVKYHERCTESVEYIFDNYQYVRSRSFYSKDNPDIYLTIVLKRNTHYLLSVCDEYIKSGKLQLTLYDKDEKMIATSDPSKSNQFISFKPSISGKYLIKAKFDSKDDGCCAVILGILREEV